MERSELKKKESFATRNETQVWKKERVLDEGGMSTVEIILILVVLIALVVIFRDQITALVNNIFASINRSAAGIY